MRMEWNGLSILVLLYLALVPPNQANGDIGRLSDAIVTNFMRTDAQPDDYFPGYNWVAIAGGVDGSVGLRSTGAIHYTTNPRYDGSGYPGYEQFELPGPFAQVCCGGAMTLAIQADGSLAAWKSGSAISVPGGSDYAQVAAGYEHQYALREDGSILAWGWNGLGQLNVPSGTFVQVAAGHDHGAALRADRSIVAWGDNSYGQCDVPADEHDFIAVAANYYDTYALRADGTIVGWGDNSLFQLNIPSVNGFTQIRGGGTGWGATALRSDGSGYYWGYSGLTYINPGPILAISDGGGNIIVPRRNYQDLLVTGTGADALLNHTVTVHGVIRFQTAMTWEYDATIIDRLINNHFYADPGSSLTLLLDGHTPVAGETYRLITDLYSPIVGTFDSINLPDIGPNLGWDTSGLYSGGFICVVPEPATLWVLALGGLPGWHGHRRGGQRRYSAIGV